MAVLSGLTPVDFWTEFEAISQIPRCTGSEAAILDYISKAAEAKGHSTQRDAVGNLIVRIAASKGFEDKAGIIIQGHVDMVCEKNRGTEHDFSCDPLELKIKDGWIEAQGTTLGADNGIAVAMMLCLIKGDYDHPALELLFTIDEEEGLLGALELDASLLSYKRLINIDSEEEGYFYIGCAGGKETRGSFELSFEQIGHGWEEAEFRVHGLNGGHSGADIHKELGNAIVLGARVLYDLNAKSLIRLIDVHGGDKHNAIPREFTAKLAYDPSNEAQISAIIKDFETQFKNEFLETEANLLLSLKKIEQTTNDPHLQNPHNRDKVWEKQCQTKVLELMYSMPHGIYSMSRTLDNLVSTSTNFARVRVEDGNLTILTSQRSDIQSLSDFIATKVVTSIKAAGGEAYSTREYPGWTPNPESPWVKEIMKVYDDYPEARDPQVLSIHAGLECGVIGHKIPGIEMISFGPDIRGAHSPDERVNIKSAERVFNFLIFLLQRI